MQNLALQAVPDQVLSVVLAKQDCQIHVFQKGQNVFIDLIANGVTVVLTRLARNAVPVLRKKYGGFSGDLMFIDMQGQSDPDYTGLGSRYKLAYIEAYEL